MSKNGSIMYIHSSNMYLAAFQNLEEGWWSNLSAIFRKPRYPCLGKVDVPSSNTTRIWTFVCECYVVRCGFKNRHQIHMCLNNNGSIMYIHSANMYLAAFQNLKEGWWSNLSAIFRKPYPCLGKVDVPSSNTTRIWTFVCECYVVRCGFKNKHQIHKCLKKIGLHAQNTLIIYTS